MKNHLILALAASTLLGAAAQTKTTETMSMASLSGTFKSLDAPTAGAVSVAKAGAGYTLKISNFKTEPAPDLHVWLFSGVPTEKGTDLKKQPYLDLGTLKTDAKTASIAIPAGTDLSKYKSVVLWCDQFSVAFAAAELK